MPRYKSLAERLIANSVLSTENFYDGTPCWEWIGALRRNQYGTLSMRYKSGPRKGKHYTASAHRVSVQVFHQGKRVTPKTVILHLCNNPRCINPAHLVGGTQARNVRQCVADGRHKTPFRDPSMKEAR